MHPSTMEIIIPQVTRKSESAVTSQKLFVVTTYNLLSDADFELAASKNITIELLTDNYVEDKRLSEIANKADKSYVDE